MKTYIIIFIGILNFSIVQCQELPTDTTTNTNIKMTKKIENTKISKQLTDNEWREKLDSESYHVLRESGTERAFTGKFYKFDKDGLYHCAGCNTALFGSETKFDSDCGWPSFYDVKENDNIKLIIDNKFGMIRTEVRCSHCNGHLGHVFEDGPNPTGLRYCINSAALEFEGVKNDSTLKIK